MERPYSFAGSDLSFSKYSLAFSFVCVVHATAPGTSDTQHRGACCGHDESRSHQITKRTLSKLIFILIAKFMEC